MTDLAIIHRPGRCAGHPTVGETRITVHGIINRLKLYDWDRDTALTLGEVIATPEQVDAAIVYYREHPDEIEQIIAEQTAAYEEGLRRQKERQ